MILIEKFSFFLAGSTFYSFFGLLMGASLSISKRQVALMTSLPRQLISRKLPVCSCHPAKSQQHRDLGTFSQQLMSSQPKSAAEFDGCVCHNLFADSCSDPITWLVQKYTGLNDAKSTLAATLAHASCSKSFTMQSIHAKQSSFCCS